MKFCHLPRAVAAVIVTITMTVPPLAAQQGHSPFQATPVAGDVTGWQVAEVTPLDIAGTAVSLSPDGTTIAGFDPDARLCFWTVPNLEQTCADAPPGEPVRIDPDSIAWAPDSSAVAYSVPAYQFFIDGDIYVVDRESGTTSNITDDGIEDVSLMAEDAEPTPIDVMPAWTPDSAAIVFSRTVWDDREEMSNEIMRVPRDGSEPETLLSLAGLPAAIYLPMRVLSDGSILYTVGFSDLDEPTNGLWMLSPDGEATQLMPGNAEAAFPTPLVNDVWEGDGELRVAGFSPLLVSQSDPTTQVSFVWSSVTGEAVPIEGSTGDTPGILFAGAISPDGQTLLSIERPIGQMPLVALQGPETSATELAEFDAETGPGRPRYITATWSDTNLVLISPVLTDGAYLVTVEPMPAT
jgi:hypothetical protein